MFLSHGAHSTLMRLLKLECVFIMDGLKRDMLDDLPWCVEFFSVVVRGLCFQVLMHDCLHLLKDFIFVMLVFTLSVYYLVFQVAM